MKKFTYNTDDGCLIKEESLQTKYKTLIKLIEHNPDDITLLDSKGRLLYRNYSEEGFKEEETLGKNFFKLLPEIIKLPFKKYNEIAQNTGTTQKIEYSKKNSKGRKKYFEIYLIPIFENEKFINTMVITRDITDKKLVEEKLRNSETRLVEMNAAKDKFLNIIAHDLRSPFSSIVGFSNLLEEQMKEQNYEGIEEYAKYIQQSSKHALALVTNLFEWTRTQTGKMVFKPEYIDLVGLINEVIEITKDSAIHKSITIEKELPRNLNIVADRVMIGNILRNLLSNAVKFSNVGGFIKTSSRQRSKELIITVSDNGIGISSEDRKKLFCKDINHTSLGTLNEKGTGFGLLLCKEYVEKHNGKIYVESTLGNGSKFYFTIPKDMNNSIIQEEFFHLQEETEKRKICN